MYHKFLVLLILITSSLLSSAAEFPLCLYGVTNSEDLKAIKQAGFNCIQTYSNDADLLSKLASEAQKQRLKVVFRPQAIIDTPYAQKAQKWPILAWYLVDEPDVKRWSREQVTQAHQAAKKAFPQQPTALVIGQGQTKIPYYDIPDVMMMDWYPVPHYPLTSFGDNVRYTQEGMATLNSQAHPLWGVVQAFDWKNYEQYRPDNDRIGRFPTVEEMRFMSYDGILNGATGLFYYTFNHAGKPMPQSAPAYWARVKTVVTQLAKFKKIIEKGTVVANPVTVSGLLKMQTWQYKGHLYSVLLNTSAQPQPVPPQLLHKTYRPVYGTQKTTHLPAYGVWIVKK